MSFENYPKEEGLESYDAFDVWEDKKGRTWITSTHFGVFQHQASKNSEKTSNHFTTENGLAHDRAMCIYEDKAGGIWIGTEGGISYYDGKDVPASQVKFRNFTVKDGLTQNSINTFMEDKTGKIWVGTRGSLSIYDPLAKLKKGEVPFTSITNKEGKTFENIWSILEDTQGNIWLGGENGLWRYDGHTYTHLITTNTSGVYEDKKGNVWFIHNNPGGLSRYNQNVLTQSNPIATQVFTSNNMLFGLTEDKNGDIWVGDLSGVFRYDGKSITYFRKK